VYIGNDGEVVHQPLAFGSQKFSAQALKWHTFEKEAYAIYYAVKKEEYFLRAKFFLLQTDHNNLRWMESSSIPKVVRWFIYLQGFYFLIEHIPGRLNIVADWQSRFFTISAMNLYGMYNDSVNDVLQQVHGSRAGHHGVRRTWLILNEHFPGHGIPYSVVYDYVLTCPVCQKVRLGHNDKIDGVTRHLKVENPRSAVGVDVLSLEEDELGYKYAIVMRNFFTKFVFIYPTKNKLAETMADAIFVFMTQFGVVDMIVSDPGSDLTSGVVATLNSWFGIHHRVSLVDRHESNNVEGANKNILRHIRALCMDLRIKSKWSRPSVINWIMFIMNKFDIDESGIDSYTLHFGSRDAAYFRAPVSNLSPSELNKYVIDLDNDLNDVRAAALEYQQGLVKKRLSSNGTVQNVYQPGDFILYRRDSGKLNSHKLDPVYVGPYVVISQLKNDISARHIGLGVVKIFHVDDVKIFHGTESEARKAALVDGDQYEIDMILGYKGDTHRRTEMSFLIAFKDQSIEWVNWSDDLYRTIQYEQFCRSRSELWHLIYTVAEGKRQRSQLNKTVITEVSPGDIVFVNIRCYSTDSLWYDNLNLPDCYTIVYVVKYCYESLTHNRLRINVRCDLFGEHFVADHAFVREYGSVKEFDNNFMVLVDEVFIQSYPQVGRN
jgi:hypothetical protein